MELNWYKIKARAELHIPLKKEGIAQVINGLGDPRYTIPPSQAKAGGV